MEQQPEKAALEELITVYCRAWSEPERVLREQLLNRVWADDGTYTDPTAHVVGRKELVEHIGKFGSFHETTKVVNSLRISTAGITMKA